MAVVEYKMHKSGSAKIVPDFIAECGHWYNPVDHTFVGWVHDTPDYYIPDTLVYLNKDQFVARVLTMHAQEPLRAGNDEMAVGGELLTTEQVSALASSWYDEFVTRNTPVG